jgi:hypothetical protein
MMCMHAFDTTMKGQTIETHVSSQQSTSRLRVAGSQVSCKPHRKNGASVQFTVVHGTLSAARC